MTRPRVLVVDDDAAIVRGVCGLLADEGFRTVSAASPRQAEGILDDPRDPPAMMLLDLRMPGEGGLDFLARLPRPLPLPVVILSGEASISDAVRALKLGASDFIEKPPQPERVLTAVRNALALRALAEERERLLADLQQPGTLVGDSEQMTALRATIARLGPSDAVALVLGETGSGKERVSRALHLASGRAGRFVAVNCAAIPGPLLESELFGHERGAFSGADRRRIGRFEQAHGGTLLLDEIGELPLDLQAKLLRVLEAREIERLGGSEPVPLDVRVVAATHVDLQRAVAEGAFRQDLYYRLAVLPIRVPPLRERPADIAPLARAFAAELLGPRGELALPPDGEAALRAWSWPGNVRELRNVIERVLLLRGEGPVVLDRAAVDRALGLFDAAVRPGAPSGLGERPLRELLEDHERALLRAALEKEGGNIAAAARLLGMDRGNLHRRLRALGVG